MRSWPAPTLILGAAYTLWLVKRVIFGAVANDHVAALKDVNAARVHRARRARGRRAGAGAVARAAARRDAADARATGATDDGEQAVNDVSTSMLDLQRSAPEIFLLSARLRDPAARPVRLGPAPLDHVRGVAGGARGHGLDHRDHRRRRAHGRVGGHVRGGPGGQSAQDRGLRRSRRVVPVLARVPAQARHPARRVLRAGAVRAARHHGAGLGEQPRDDLPRCRAAVALAVRDGRVQPRVGHRGRIRDEVLRARRRLLRARCCSACR